MSSTELCVVKRLMRRRIRTMRRLSVCFTSRSRWGHFHQTRPFSTTQWALSIVSTRQIKSSRLQQSITKHRRLHRRVRSRKQTAPGFVVEEVLQTLRSTISKRQRLGRPCSIVRRTGHIRHKLEASTHHIWHRLRLTDLQALIEMISSEIRHLTHSRVITSRWGSFSRLLSQQIASLAQNLAQKVEL